MKPVKNLIKTFKINVKGQNADEKEELAVIEKYLPEQMGEEELKKILQDIIAKTGASGMQDMGKVMGMATKELSGKADGKTISTIVRELLG